MLLKIINPNTTGEITRIITETAKSVALPTTEIVGVNPVSGPASIECHLEDAIASVGVLEVILSGETTEPDAYIIACFGDPGLKAARELASVPVIGIAEAALHVASMVSSRFAIVTSADRTRIMLEDLVASYGFEKQCPRVIATDIGVLDMMNKTLVWRQLLSTGQGAVDEGGVGAIILGCSAMSIFKVDLERALGIPVIDGVMSAVKLAESLVGLGLKTSKATDYGNPPAKIFEGVYKHFSREE